MIKKLLALILLLFALYGVSIFLLPQVASQVDTILRLPGLSERIRGNKEVIEGAITDIPSIHEFKSGAIDAKNTFLNGVDVTKEKIDTLREGAQKAEETYNQAQETIDQAKDTFNKAKEVFDTASQTLNQVQGVVDEVNQLTGSGS